MDGSFKPGLTNGVLDLDAPLRRILALQTPEGAILWFENGPWDPWNHVESAMALTVMGRTEAASAAFDYLYATQRPDGAWFGEYGNALPMVDRDFISREPAPRLVDTNFCAYPAVGVAHFALATGNWHRARKWWPMIKASIDFVVSLQRDDGAIPWSLEAINTPDDDALLAGNASIAKSLECAIFLAGRFDEPVGSWRQARAKLIQALHDQPDAFDRRATGQRFAMDWYYPVLSGALSKTSARQRLDQLWSRFVIPGKGCRCVSDEPWVTVAETCELVIALLALGERSSAERLFRQAMSIRDSSGVLWMGWQTAERVVWPKEQPSWTQAAAILAADALEGFSTANRILVASVL
ncbi:hypothetical protein [Henriciella sp.]|uniref:hypothetical protein n=1 Tax=Henriciella sp. TaxID=1968823 RepID=UPI00261F2618|nr:hypothetical protein [Henriciella sp.]